MIPNLYNIYANVRSLVTLPNIMTIEIHVYVKKDYVHTMIYHYSTSNGNKIPIETKVSEILLVDLCKM